MPLEPFDGVQFGTIGRQPDHLHAMFEQAQSGQRGGTAMKRSSVHHQDNLLRRVAADEEVVQEVDEMLTVLAFGQGPTDLVGPPIVGAEDMDVLLVLVGWDRDPLLLAHFHPASSQNRLQAHGRFVNKEELDFVSLDPFFSSSNSWRACSFPSGSWR